MVQRKKPSVFVGSSTEGLDVAKAIQVSLDHTCEVQLWTQGVFGVGQATLQSLIDITNKHDFAILVLTPDDVKTSRGSSSPVPRDNVIFELGLCAGILGIGRAFFVYDRSIELRLPSDIHGITPSTYEPHASGNLASALGAACTEIENQIRKLGPRKSTEVHSHLGVVEVGKYESSMIARFSRQAISEVYDSEQFGKTRTVNVDISGHSLWGTVRPRDWIQQTKQPDDALSVLRDHHDSIDTLDLHGAIFANINELLARDPDVHFVLRVLLLHPDSEQASQVYQAQRNSPDTATEEWRNARTDAYLSLYILNRISMTHERIALQAVNILPIAKWMSFSLTRIHNNALCASYPCTQLLDKAVCMWLSDNSGSPFGAYAGKFENIIMDEEATHKIPFGTANCDDTSEFRESIDRIIGHEVNEH